jgi:hypothetical protein
MAETVVVPLVPPLEGPDPEGLVEVAEALRVLSEHPYWQTLVSWVNHELVLSNHNGLRDQSQPREYYCGVGDGMQLVLGIPKSAVELARAAVDAMKEQNDRRALFASGEGDLA